MAGKVVEYIIRVKDLGSAAIRRFTSTLASTVRSAAGIGKSLADAIFRPTWLKAAGISSLFAGLAATIRQAFKVETAITQFAVLLGSMEKAKKVFAELKKFSDATPFTFDEVAQAGRMLLAFGEDAKTLQATLTTLGDIASAVGMPFTELAEIYGKNRVQGRLMAQDINQLTGRGIPVIGQFAKILGVSTEEVRGLVEQGKVGFPILEQAFKNMTGPGGQFAGMMDKLSTTGEGLFSTLLGEWSGALADFGKELMALAKDGIGFAITKIKELRENGTITRWAKETNEALTLVKDTLASIFSGDTETLKLTFNVLKEGVKDAFGAAVDLLWSAMPALGKMLGASARAAFDMRPISGSELRKAATDLGLKEGYTAKELQAMPPGSEQRMGEMINARARENRLRDAYKAQGLEFDNPGGKQRASGFSGALDALRAHVTPTPALLSPQDAVNKAFPPIATQAAPMPEAATAVASAAAGSPDKPEKPGKPNVAAMTRALLDMNAGTGLSASGLMATAAPLEGLDAYVSDHTRRGGRGGGVSRRVMSGSGMGGFMNSFAGKVVAASSAGLPSTAPAGSLLDPQKQTVEELKKVNATLERKLGMRR